jgi:hypothetical protein
MRRFILCTALLLSSSAYAATRTSVQLFATGQVDISSSPGTISVAYTNGGSGTSNFLLQASNDGETWYAIKQVIGCCFTLNFQLSAHYLQLTNLDGHQPAPLPSGATLFASWSSQNNTTSVATEFIAPSAIGNVVDLGANNMPGQFGVDISGAANNSQIVIQASGYISGVCPSGSNPVWATLTTLTGAYVGTTLNSTLPCVRTYFQTAYVASATISFYSLEPLYGTSGSGSCTTTGQVGIGNGTTTYCGFPYIAEGPEIIALTDGGEISIGAFLVSEPTNGSIVLNNQDNDGGGIIQSQVWIGNGVDSPGEIIDELTNDGGTTVLAYSDWSGIFGGVYTVSSGDGGYLDLVQNGASVANLSLGLTGPGQFFLSGDYSLPDGGSVINSDGWLVQTSVYGDKIESSSQGTYFNAGNSIDWVVTPDAPIICDAGTACLPTALQIEKQLPIVTQGSVIAIDLPPAITIINSIPECNIGDTIRLHIVSKTPGGTGISVTMDGGLGNNTFAVNPFTQNSFDLLGVVVNNAVDGGSIDWF